MDARNTETTTVTVNESRKTASTAPAPQEGAGAVGQVINIRAGAGPGVNSAGHTPSLQPQVKNCSKSEDDDDSLFFSEHKKKRKSESCVFCKREMVREEDHYPVNGTKHLIIFNFKEFLDPKIPPRKWTEHDVENLKRVFGQIGYDTDKYFENCDCLDFFSKLYEISQMEELDDCSVFILAIMSHGAGTDDCQSFITIDDQDVNMDQVCAFFDDVHCPRLKGKPKIFLACFCRNRTETSAGSAPPISENETQETNPAVDPGLLSNIDSEIACADRLLALTSENSPENDPIAQMSPEEIEEALKCISKFGPNPHEESNDGTNITHQVRDENESIPELPLYSRNNCKDMIIMYSCQEGKQSVRKEGCGVIFIRELCRSVEKYGRRYNVERIFADVEERMRNMCPTQDRHSLNGYDPQKKTAIFKTCYLF